MSKKLSEILSAKKGPSVTIHGVELSFRRFTLDDSLKLNDKMKASDENDPTVMIDVVYDQLTEESQEQFGDLKTFKEVVDQETFMKLLDTFNELQGDSEPKKTKK